MMTFLELNGFELDQTQDEIADTFIALGRKEIDQPGFFAWVSAHARPQSSLRLMPDVQTD